MQPPVCMRLWCRVGVRIGTLGSGPADARGCAGSLRKLEAKGNALEALPDGISALTAFRVHT